MAESRHFQLHPEYTDDDGNVYAVDTSGTFYLFADSVLSDDRIDARELSDGMRMLTVEDADVADDIVFSEELGPDEVPIVDGF